MSTSVKFTLFLIGNVIGICLVDLMGQYFKWWPSVLNFEEILMISGFYALLFAIKDTPKTHAGNKE